MDMAGVRGCFTAKGGELRPRCWCYPGSSGGMEGRIIDAENPPWIMSKKDNPYIFAENLAGFRVYFVSDPTLERGEAKMFMNPDDYEEMKLKMEKDEEI